MLSVNLADVRTVRLGGKERRTGIWKLPAEGAVGVGSLGLEGDVQADRRVHGGPDQAVYAYAREDVEWWEGELGRPLEHGTFGENLTLGGVELTHALIGERWRVGKSVLEVSAPRIPCAKLAAKMGDRRFVKRFAAAGRPGAYLRVIEEGELAAGAAAERLGRPDHDVTVLIAFRALLGEKDLVPRLIEAPQLPERVRSWAARKIAATV